MLVGRIRHWKVLLLKPEVFHQPDHSLVGIEKSHPTQFDRDVVHSRQYEREEATADPVTVFEEPNTELMVRPCGGKLTQLSPKLLGGDVWRTYADHRMAQAGALLGLVVPDVVLDDIGCTDKTMPEFADLWQGMIDSSQVETGP